MYAGIQSTDMSQNKLSVFAGCNTATGSDNITKRAYTQGSDVTIGWTNEVDASSHSKWLERFTNELAVGKPVSKAAEYANSFTYSDTKVKSYKIYGDTALIIKRSVLSKNLENRNVEVNEDIQVDVSHNQLDKLNRYMTDNIGLNFDNVITEVTNLSGGNGVVDYKLCINGIETTSGYVAIINDGIVVNIYKNNVDVPVPMNIDIEEVDVNAAFEEAREHINEYDEIISQEGKKVYDVVSRECYYLVFTKYKIADNCTSVESYKFWR